MSKIKHILSVIHYTICGAVCFQFTHFPCDDWENIYTLFYYHHQIGRMDYYPLFRATLWNNGVHCMSFYILLNYCYPCFFFRSCESGWLNWKGMSQTWWLMSIGASEYIPDTCWLQLKIRWFVQITFTIWDTLSLVRGYFARWSTKSRERSRHWVVNKLRWRQNVHH